MQDLAEELVYVEKMDRIAGELEELILDALLATLRKIKERNELFNHLAQSALKSGLAF
jgi:hypothetical protein